MTSVRRTSVQYIQISEDPDHAVHQHEGAGTHAGQVHQRAEHDGQDEAAQAAGRPTMPLMVPMLLG